MEITSFDLSCVSIGFMELNDAIFDAEFEYRIKAGGNNFMEGIAPVDDFCKGMSYARKILWDIAEKKLKDEVVTNENQA